MPEMLRQRLNKRTARIVEPTRIAESGWLARRHSTQGRTSLAWAHRGLLLGSTLTLILLEKLMRQMNNKRPSQQKPIGGGGLFQFEASYWWPLAAAQQETHR